MLSQSFSDQLCYSWWYTRSDYLVWGDDIQSDMAWGPLQMPYIIINFIDTPSQQQKFSQQIHYQINIIPPNLKQLLHLPNPKMTNLQYPNYTVQPKINPIKIQNIITYHPTPQKTLLHKNMSTTISQYNRVQSSKLSRHQSSFHDSEQQLRTLIHIIEEYNQHYSELLQQHRDTIKNAVNFDDFINKVKLRPELEIQMLYQGMKGTRKMLQELFNKCLLILPQVARQSAEYKNKIIQLHEQLDDKQLYIEGLKQNKQQTQKHLREITAMYEKMRSENIELNEKMNQKQQEFQTESREIRKTFMEVTQSSQMEKKILTELYESNQKMSTTIIEMKIDKKNIEKELQLLNMELSKSNTKVQVLQTELIRKQNKIRQCEAQIQSIYMSNRKQSGNSMVGSINGSQQQTYIRQSFNQQFQDRKLDKTKLNQQLYNYKMPSVKELNGSFVMGSNIKGSIGDQNDYVQYQQMTKNRESYQNGETYPNRESYQMQEQPKQQKKKSKDVFDPYFSHYILISQSVKIKQDCQDMLNIDMKPYYEQIIQKRIPMHLWDQWVKNRLRELLRQLYPTQ